MHANSQSVKKCNIRDSFIFIFQISFIVMQSIFWPSRRIRDKYDLKGCLKGRREKSQKSEAGNSNTDSEHVVLKDANFVGKETSSTFST